MKIKISQLDHIVQELESRLVDIWEGAVRAAHHFLSETDILSIKSQVSDALRLGQSALCPADGKALSGPF